MFRKLAIALAATAAIGVAALAPTSASAKPWHHHHGWHHGWHGGFGYFGYGPAYYVPGGGCYIVKRVVLTPWGKRVRRVEVCD